jgi:glutamine amidotransferase
MQRRIAVIDYGGGNLHSVEAGLRRVMQEGDDLQLIAAPQHLERATHIILPGVGSFGQCIAALRQCEGMIAALDALVLRQQRPFLGICVGMQMLFERGLEHGTYEGLGWLPGEVAPIVRRNKAQRIPHMGWNNLLFHKDHPIVKGMDTSHDVYFVHSYHAAHVAPQHLVATVEYGESLTALVAHGSVIGAQFHPEKSHRAGQVLLENFLQMR